MNSFSKPTRIVSGGQTGVDRAALDVAIYLGIPHGGWCPQGRLAEDGTIPDSYQLQETDSQKYRIRTEKNVVHSDGTLILYHQAMSKGTALTSRLAESMGRPLLCLDLEDFETWTESEIAKAIEEAHQWITKNNVAVLNVAGPRKSSCPEIGKAAEQFLIHLLSDKRQPA